VRASLPILFLLSGCVQLVAFEQPIIGQPDVVEQGGGSSSGLCDNDIQMGQSALCTESCEIDTRRAETSCRSRVTLDGASGTIDVSGLHEVELTVTVCEREGDLFEVRGGNGATVALRDRSLHVVAAAVAEAQPFEDSEFLSDDEGCEDRTLLLQTGRMALIDSGRRLCSDHIVPVDGEWAFELSRHSLRSVELCFRAPR